MSTTIRDVAKRAGVGIATVSRVLNNSSAVKLETRQRVLQAIKELDYTPNPIARRLSTGQTLTIGVIVPFFTLPDFVKRLQGVQQAIAESKYDLILFNVESIEQKDRYFEDLPRNTRVDGVLIIALPLTNYQVSQFKMANIPVVLIDAVHPEVHQVCVDHIEGAKMAMRHLISLGHRKIAFVSDYLESPFEFVATKQRYTGYREALDEAQLPFNPEYHLQGEFGREAARKMGQQLFSLKDPPTAVFAGSDTQAIGVLEAAREHGIQVPEQLSIVGYNDIRDAEYMELTTIRQPLFESGFEAVKLLFQEIEFPSPHPQKKVLPVELIVRKTTASLSFPS